MVDSCECRITVQVITLVRTWILQEVRDGFDSKLAVEFVSIVFGCSDEINALEG